MHAVTQLPTLIPISQTEPEIQLHAKLLLVERGLLEAVWHSRDTVRKISFDRRTRRIFINADRTSTPVQAIACSLKGLRSWRVETSDCFDTEDLDESMHGCVAEFDLWDDELIPHVAAQVHRIGQYARPQTLCA